MLVRSRSRARLVLAVVAALALAGPAGCGRLAGGPSPAPGGGGPPAPAGTEPAGEQPTAAPSTRTVEPCALLTDAEAERLAGTPLEDPVPVRDTCTWTGPVTGPTAQVEIFVGDGAKKFLDIDRDLGHEIWSLPGVGDEAYAEDSVVFVNKGGLWVSIRLTLLSDPREKRAELAELARTVAGRI